MFGEINPKPLGNINNTSYQHSSLVITGNTDSFPQTTSDALDVTGVVNLNTSGSSTMNIGTGSYAGTVFLGNSASTFTTVGTIRINTGGSALTGIGSGTYGGTINIGNIAFNPTTNIAGVINIGTSSSGAIGIGTGSYAGTLTIGNSLITAVNITAPLNVNTSGSAAINIGTSSYSGTIDIGTSAGPSVVNCDGTFNFLTTSSFPGIIPRDVFCYSFFGGF